MTHPTLSIQRARVAAALTAGDLGALRELLTDGATFASLTIQAATARAEATFTRWLELGRPDDITLTGDLYLATSRNRRLASVRALTDGQILEIASAGSPLAEQLFRAATFGYGYAKSAFALACAGFGRLGCIDSKLERKHAARLAALAAGHGARDWPAGIRSKAGRDLYLAALEALWPGPDSASGQWLEWLADLEFSTDHGILTGGTTA